MLLLEHESTEPVRVDEIEGEVFAFSARDPEKEVNQDAAAVLPYPGGGLLAVADGMGGMNAGERASRLALETLAARLEQGARDGQPLRNAVMDGLEAANRSILDLGVGAGTTFAAFLIEEGRARAIHVGDSVALHCGLRGRVKAQTVPHSPTGYLVEAGLLAEREALQHEERHIVSNHLGLKSMRIEVGPAVPIAEHDTLLVASDGLADNLMPDEVVRLARKGPLERAAIELARCARRRMSESAPEKPGKPDDLTYLLFRRARERSGS